MPSLCHQQSGTVSLRSATRDAFYFSPATQGATGETWTASTGARTSVPCETEPGCSRPTTPPRGDAGSSPRPTAPRCASCCRASIEEGVSREPREARSRAAERPATVRRPLPGPWARTDGSRAGPDLDASAPGPAPLRARGNGLVVGARTVDD